MRDVRFSKRGRTAVEETSSPTVSILLDFFSGRHSGFCVSTKDASKKRQQSSVGGTKWSFSTSITIYFAIKQHDKYTHSRTINTVSSRTRALCLYEQIYVVNTDHKTFPLTTILLIRNPLYSSSVVTVLSVRLLFQYKFLKHEACEKS